MFFSDVPFSTFILLMLPVLINVWGIYHAGHHKFPSEGEGTLWICLCIFLPILGGLLYLAFGLKRSSPLVLEENDNFINIREKCKENDSDEECYEEGADYNDFTLGIPEDLMRGDVNLVDEEDKNGKDSVNLAGEQDNEDTEATNNSDEKIASEDEPMTKLPDDTQENALLENGEHSTESTDTKNANDTPAPHKGDSK